MKTWRLRALACAALVATLLFESTRKQSMANDEAAMPPARLATFLARLLAYDSNLEARAKGSVGIAVLYNGQDKAAATAGEAMTAAVKTLELTRILDLPIGVYGVPADSAQALTEVIQSRGIDTVIVCSRLVEQQPWILSVSEKNSAITVGLTSAQVRSGIAVGVYLESGKSKILINLPASKRARAAFSPDLLRLSEVIQ